MTKRNPVNPLGMTRGDFIRESSASLATLSLCGAAAGTGTGHSYGSNCIGLSGTWWIRSPQMQAYPTTVPSTVLAALVRNGLYREPYVGMNLRAIPGTTYPIGAMFANLEMPADSPFRLPWRYETTFTFPKSFHGKRVALSIGGINYRASAWLNGRKVAGPDRLAGMWRSFEFDVTDFLRNGTNVLAFDVAAPTPDDLALTFVDWNPMPPDKCMGLFREVSLVASGPVTVRHPQVIARLESSLERAFLSVFLELQNLVHEPVHGTLYARIGGRKLTRSVALGASERRIVALTPQHHAALTFEHPQLWWPAQMGDQPMQHLDVWFEVDGEISDREETNFGIREVTSEVDAHGHRLFSVNGRRMLILGAGWTFDMMLRDTAQRQEDQIRYIRDMHLNTVRLEGKIGDDTFFDLCDRYGIMVMAGWCCCDRWERWNEWTPENYLIAEESLRTQVRRLRNHPSLLTWLYGSDNAPPRDVEEIYQRVLREERWPNPYQAAASARTTQIGNTGFKMTGPYDYVAPSYWLDTRAPGGASGFNSETSPGPAVPPVESLRRFIPRDHLWPIDAVWNFHAGSGHFKNIESFTRALEARYGAATGVQDYARKAQLMTYEGERAMFEAFRRNKYVATGVIQWMLNNSWPGLIWHLYDYYLCPAGGYFGAKKACEPLHVQYSYDDRSVVVTNEHHRAFPGYAVIAEAYDATAKAVFGESLPLDIPPDSATRAFVVPPYGGSPLYFLRLKLRDAGGATVSTNLYWLAERGDRFDWSKSTWYDTPLVEYADFTALQSLPKAEIALESKTRHEGDRNVTEVTLRNPSPHFAFFLHAAVRKGASGEEVLPVLWNDNYVSLFPGERCVLHASYRRSDLDGVAPSVSVEGWNALSH